MYCFVNSDICTNLLGTRMVRDTGILCEVPMYFLVICRMQLSYMVNSFIDTNLIHNFYINYIKLSSSTCFERHRNM